MGEGRGKGGVGRGKGRGSTRLLGVLPAARRRQVGVHRVARALEDAREFPTPRSRSPGIAQLYKIFSHVRRLTPLVTLLNFGFMICVVWMPVATSLLDFRDRTPYICYAVTLFTTRLLLAITSVHTSTPSTRRRHAGDHVLNHPARSTDVGKIFATVGTFLQSRRRGEELRVRRPVRPGRDSRRLRSRARLQPPGVLRPDRPQGAGLLGTQAPLPGADDGRWVTMYIELSP